MYRHIHEQRFRLILRSFIHMHLCAAIILVSLNHEIILNRSTLLFITLWVIAEILIYWLSEASVIAYN